MTPKKLTNLIVKGDRAKLCAALAPLDEQQREQLSEAVLTIYKKIGKAWGPGAPDGIDDQVRQDPELAPMIDLLSAETYEDWRVPRWTAGLAVLALCDAKQFEKYWEFGSWFAGDIRDMPHRVIQILDARRPKWLASWEKSWFVARGLIRSGALPANKNDDYITEMAAAIPRHLYAISQPAVTTDNLPDLPTELNDLLLADPALLDDEVWRLFEVEASAFDSENTVWFWTLPKLCEAGQLDRERLLGASVRGMALPFRTAAISGYGKFHEALRPTIDERAAVVADYLLLLGSDTPVVVGNALDALEELAKANRLDAATFLEACPSVFRLAKKTQPRKAIKLVKRLLKADPTCDAAASVAVTAGLGHESPDVQEDAIALLETLREVTTPELQRDMLAWSDHVAAVLRPRLDALARSAAEESTSSVGSVSASSSDLSDLQARAQSFGKEVRAAAGIDAALQSIADGANPRSLTLEPKHVPRRDPADAVEPIASLDELIDTVAAVIERVDDIMDIERILDGISRFYLERPQDFSKRVAALKQRVEARSEEMSDTVLDIAANVGVAQVIRDWLGLPPWLRDRWRNQNGEFFRMRTREINWRMEIGRMYDKTGRALLALPTHRGGWLDPVTLLNRIATDTRASSGFNPDVHDFAQALLRLTADGRDEALELAAKLPGRYAEILRFALGGPGDLSKSIGNVWLDLRPVAAHARALVDDSADFGLPFSVPNALLHDDGSVCFEGPVADDPAIPEGLLSRAYSIAVQEPPEGCWGGGQGSRDWIVDWEAMIWPGNRRPICLYASLTSSPSAYLKNLSDRDTTWHAEMARLAALATSSNEVAARGLVTDALIDAIGECTVDPTMLGRHLGAIAEHLKLNRVAAVFDDVARISPLHHWSVFKTLETFVGSLESGPRDLHHILTVLLESGIVTGKTLSDEALRLLKSVKGANKCAKLAKQLLGLKHSPDRMEPVRLAALNACVERAQRWTTKQPAS